MKGFFPQIIAAGMVAMQTAAVGAFTADLRTASVVCANTNSIGCVTAAKELEKHLALVAEKRAPSPDGLVFAVGERPAGAPEPAVFESCGRVCGKRVSFWGEEAEHGLERSQGPLFAVYEFLDKKLGVKWVFPGDDGIVYSPQTSIQLSEGESWSFTPPFEVCNFYNYNTRNFRKILDVPMPKAFSVDRRELSRRLHSIEQWYNRMRIASRNREKSGHAFGNWQSRFLKDHPEWFAYVTITNVCRDGKPGRGVVDRQARYVHGCYTCPELPQVIVDDWVAKGAPKRFNFCLNDGAWFCQCPNCLALDTRLPGEEFRDHLTDRVIYFYNKVMPLAIKVRPDVDACTYIYSLYRKPPRREKLLYGDNMTFGWVPGLGDNYMDDLKAWREAGVKRFYLRPNYLCYNGVFPRGLERFLYDSFKNCMAVPGAVGVMYDGRPRPILDIEYYVLCSLAQRPDRGFDELLEEFYAQYGAAAPEAKAYFEHVRARSGAIVEFARSSRMPQLVQRVDDSELDKFAFAGHTLAGLEAELALLRPGLEKQLAAQDRVRFSRLALRAENAVLTFRFLSAAAGKDKSALQSAADALYAFRAANFAALGREGDVWLSRKNCEQDVWRRTKYLSGASAANGGAADRSAARAHAGDIFPTDVNVKDFGAKGDGTSDDTAAIQAAADEAFGRADKARVSTCWRNYSRATRKDTPMPRLVFPKGTYRLTGPVFFRGRAQLYGLGGPVITASSPDMDMFVFHYSVRHYVQGFTMEGGRHQFLVETYNIDSANFTARDCTFRRSSASAVDSHNWRLATIGRKEVKKKNGRVGTYMPNPSGPGFVRDPRRNSSSVVRYNNSTLITIERCRFEDCAMVADITPDGAVLRDLTVVTSVSKECVFRLAGNIHAYGLSVTTGRPVGAKNFAVFEFQHGHSMIENSKFDSCDGAGVCLVRSKSKLTTASASPLSIILRNLDVACGGCPEGAIISCQHQTTPEIIAVTDVRDTTGKAVKAVAFEGGITAADYDDIRFFKNIDSRCSYALSLGRNSPNVDSSLPEAAERFRDDAAGVPHAISSLKVPVSSAGRVLWGGDYGISADSGGDDTEGLQRLFDAAARHPGCVAVLPPRSFTLKGTLTLAGKFTVRAAGTAVVMTKDDSLTLFRIAEGADVTFEHLFFEGGARHVVCTADQETRVMLDCCYSYDAAQPAYVMRSPKTKGAIKFTMNGGVSIAPMLYDGNADAVISDTWFYMIAPQPPDVMFQSAVGLVNEGKMLYQDVLGCPGLFESVKRDGRFDDLMAHMAERKADLRWIDNKGGELHSQHSRFGGEFGGLTLVYNSEGGKVLIEGNLAGIRLPFTRCTPVFSDEPDADVRMFGVSFPLHYGDMLLQYRCADGTAKAMPRQAVCCVLPRPSGSLGRDLK